MENYQSVQSKRAIDLTAGELADLVAMRLKDLMKPEKKDKSYKRGINGIMEIFDCSRAKASRIRKSGVLDDATTPTGRSFIVDVDMAISLMKKKSDKRGRK